MLRLNSNIRAAINELDFFIGIVLFDGGDNRVHIIRHAEYGTNGVFHFGCSFAHVTKIFWNGPMPASATVMAAGNLRPS